MNKVFINAIISDVTIITIEDIKKWVNEKGNFMFDFIIKLVIAVFLYAILSKVLKKIATSIQSKLDNKGIDKIASHFIINIIRYGILIFALFTIITQLKIVEVTSIAALVASAGVGISLAMQGALSNFAGGILLLILKPFKKGDYIVIPSANIEGTVEIIETYYTTIKTIFGEEVKIPNSQLTNNSVLNRGGSESRALLIKVGISYDTDIDLAKNVLKNIIDSQENILGTPRDVFVEELSEHSIIMGILCMVSVSEYNNVRRQLNERILIGLRENNIEIPFNQLDVHVIDK
ncbi:MAG: mechanosensitive ion channel family protein [Eubacterium sp.]|nr:mechanosensitive ion channel family protein [Eubacterium sp.]